MDGSIRDILAGTGQGLKALWAKFDPEWYKKAYSDAGDVDDPLEFYLTEGIKLGHSPNIFFDEEWYLRRYPIVIEEIRNRKVQSGFEHYCRYGLHKLSPHWLFDAERYRRLHTDLIPASLERGGCVNLYDHYIRFGARERRDAHLLFSPSLYSKNIASYLDQPINSSFCPYTHYLNWIETGNADIQVTYYFNHEWYVIKYPKVGAAIEAGEYRCALHHYLGNSEPTQYDPLPYFKEDYYMTRYSDMAEHIGQDKLFRNAYEHFIQHGQDEYRSPAPFIDLHYYWSRRPTIVTDTGVEDLSEPFVHLLTIGVSRGLPFAPPVAPIDVPEEHGRALFLARANNMMPLHARRPIDFRFDGEPELSVIVALHNQLPMSLMSLASLRENFNGKVQLILVDSGSTDETLFIERYVRGATYLRFDTNVGFLLACNAALPHATAPHVLYLNNDVELAPGAISAAIARLTSHPDIGAVGGKVVRTHEKLQEAGSIVWRDGHATGYMRDASPQCPEANFVRDVDFASGVFLLLRTDLLKRLEGFDAAFAPAYYEETDLCLRIWDAGYRVVYDPRVVIHHYEYGSSRDSNLAFTLMSRNQKILFAKHARRLKNHFNETRETVSTARFAGEDRPRILYVEDYVPLRRLGAGSVRSNDLIRIMAEAGYQVTVFPVHGTNASTAEIYADFPENVEIMHDRNHHHLQEFLNSRRDYFDTIWICRAHNLKFVKPALEGAGFDPRKTTVVLDTEAVFSIRESLQAKRNKQRFDMKRAIAREFEHANFCQEIVTVNEAEAGALRNFGFPHARVVGTYRPVLLTPRRWSEREGLLFVGSLYGDDTPNYDSLCWFVDEILPLVEKELGWETRLSIAGLAAPGVPLKRFANHARVTWHGAVSDLHHLYNTHRIAIAPTRFAAGTPYKVYESTSYGLPTVVTDLLAGQLGWSNGKEILSAPVDDAKAFASQIVRLYRTEDLWNTLRGDAAARLKADHSKEEYLKALSQILPKIGR